MNNLLRAMWDGFCLVCPSCRRGPIFETRRRMNTACPECGEPFDRIHEADWLITWINAYTATTLVLIAVLVPLNLFTGMSLLGQVGLSGAVSAVFLAFSYPRIKGMSIGILHMMRSRWQE